MPGGARADSDAQTDQNGSIIDTANYEGVVFIAAFGTLTAGAVTGLKAQMGDDPNLSDAADLADTAQSIADTDDNKLLVLDIHRPAERYVRAVITRGTADATIDGVIAILYGTRVLRVTQDTTVVGIETHVSPAERGRRDSWRSLLAILAGLSHPSPARRGQRGSCRSNVLVR